MISKFRRLSTVLSKPAAERSLDEKLAVSSALTAFEYGISILCRIGSTLVLTRLLSPEIFGLFAIIITFQMIVVMLTDFGVLDADPVLVVSALDQSLANRRMVVMILIQHPRILNCCISLL